MTAPAIDTSGSSLNFNAVASTLTIAATLGSSATSLWVIAPYWSSSATVGNITGITWNGVALTNVTKGNRGTNAGTVEVWCLGAPATGAHNIVVSFQSNANDGSIYWISFSNTPTSGGLGTQWADITTLTPVTSANSSLSVPNNTANDAIIDGLVTAANANPAMGAQTNRVQISTSSNGNGNGEGASYLTPAPSGSQTMNWTFASTEHTQTAVRVLGTGAAPVNETNRPEVGLEATSTAIKVGVGTARPEAGFSATARALKVGLAIARVESGIESTSTGIKLAIGTAQGEVGYEATALGSMGAITTATAQAQLGFEATSVGRKTAIGTAQASAGLDASDATLHRAIAQALAELGYDATGIGARIASATAQAEVGFRVVGFGVIPSSGGGGTPTSPYLYLVGNRIVIGIPIAPVGA